MGLLLAVHLIVLISGVFGLNNTQHRKTYSLYKLCEGECRRCDIGAASQAKCLSQCPTYTGKTNIHCKALTKLNEIAIGCGIGIFICIMVGIGVLLCVRIKHRRKDSLPKQSTKALRNFHKDLDRLRPHAYTFLGILNNVRRQVREMHRAGNTDAAVICLRSISDLAKILMLLNRKDIPIVPPDWPRLVSWAERLLERSNVPPPPPNPQVAQLIQFLQSSQKPSSSSTSSQSTPMSSMKPLKYKTSFLLHTNANSKPNTYSTKHEWKEDPWPSESHQHDIDEGHHSWIDDDFSLINFRPQDEIVTVL